MINIEGLLLIVMLTVISPFIFMVLVCIITLTFDLTMGYLQMDYEECKQWCLDMFTKLSNEGKQEEADAYGNMYGIWDDKHKASLNTTKKEYAKTYVGGELGL